MGYEVSGLENKYDKFKEDTCFMFYANKRGICVSITCFTDTSNIVEYELDYKTEKEILSKFSPMEYLMQYLNVEEGERFNVVFKNGNKHEWNPFRFSGGVLLDGYNECNDPVLTMLMNHTCFVEKLSWKPKTDELVFFVDCDGSIYSTSFTPNNVQELAMFKNKWLFHTKEEVEDNSERLLKEYDKVMNDE